MSKLIASTTIFFLLFCGAGNPFLGSKADSTKVKTKVEYTFTEIRQSIENLKFQQERLKEQWIKVQGQIELLQVMLADSPKADSPKADSPKADSPKADSTHTK